MAVYCSRPLESQKFAWQRNIRGKMFLLSRVSLNNYVEMLEGNLCSVDTYFFYAMRFFVSFSEL